MMIGVHRDCSDKRSLLSYILDQKNKTLAYREFDAFNNSLCVKTEHYGGHLTGDVRYSARLRLLCFICDYLPFYDVMRYTSLEVMCCCGQEVALLCQKNVFFLFKKVHEMLVNNNTNHHHKSQKRNLY